MTTGDLSGNISRLLKELASIKYPGTVDLAGLKNGEFEAFLPPLHFALTQYSRHLTREFLLAGNKLLGNNDHRFVESAFRIARDHLGLRTILTLAQFFERGFAERKAILLHDIVQACRKCHHAALRRQRLASVTPLQVNSAQNQLKAASTTSATSAATSGPHSSAAKHIAPVASQASTVKGQSKQPSIRKKRVSFVDDLPSAIQGSEAEQAGMNAVQSQELESADAAVKAACLAALDISNERAIAEEQRMARSIPADLEACNDSASSPVPTGPHESVGMQRQRGASPTQSASGTTAAPGWVPSSPSPAAPDAARIQCATAERSAGPSPRGQDSHAAPVLLPRFRDTWQEYKRTVGASTAMNQLSIPSQEGDRVNTGQQVRDLQGTVARLEEQDVEAAKAAEVLKARVTLLESHFRLLQRNLASQTVSASSTPHEVRALQQGASPSAAGFQSGTLTSSTQQQPAAQSSGLSCRAATGQEADAGVGPCANGATPHLPTSAQSIWPVFRPAMVLRGASVLAQPLPSHATSSPRHAQPEKHPSTFSQHTAAQGANRPGVAVTSSSNATAPWDPISNALSTAQLVAEIEAHFHQAQQLLHRHQAPTVPGHA